MRYVLRTFGISSPLAALNLVTLAAEPAWAVPVLPGPATGGLVAAAIIGALVLASIRRRK